MAARPASGLVVGEAAAAPSTASSGGPLSRDPQAETAHDRGEEQRADSNVQRHRPPPCRLTRSIITPRRCPPPEATVGAGWDEGPLFVRPGAPSMDETRRRTDGSEHGERREDGNRQSDAGARVRTADGGRRVRRRVHREPRTASRRRADDSRGIPGARGIRPTSRFATSRSSSSTTNSATTACSPRC